MSKSRHPFFSELENTNQEERFTIEMRPLRRILDNELTVEDLGGNNHLHFKYFPQ